MKKYMKLTEGALLNKYKIENVTIIVSARGNQRALKKAGISKLISSIVLAVSPTVAIRMLINTAIEVPNMFQCKVNGYIRVNRARNLIACQFVSILGLPRA